MFSVPRFLRSAKALCVALFALLALLASAPEATAQDTTLVASSIYTDEVEFTSVSGTQIVGVRIIIEWEHTADLGGRYRAWGWGPQENAPRGWSLSPSRTSVPPSTMFPTETVAAPGHLLYPLSEGNARADNPEAVEELRNRIETVYRGHSFPWQVHAIRGTRTFDSWVTFDADTVHVGETFIARAPVYNYYGQGDVSDVTLDALQFTSTDGGTVRIENGPTPATGGTLAQGEHVEFVYELVAEETGTILVEAPARGTYEGFGTSDPIVAKSLCGLYETTPCKLVILPGGLVVNVDNDEPDLDPGDEICDTDPDLDGSQCSLRAAIQEANAQVSEDPVKISFDIDGQGVPLITLESPLPPVLNPTHIGDGGTMVNLEGEGLENGILLFAPGSTLEGIAFTGFINAVAITADATTVRSSSFGRRWLSDPSAQTLEIEHTAIRVTDAADVQIGGADATPGSQVGNVIVNSRTGIVLERVSGARIWGNQIGTVEQPIIENGITAVDVTDLQIGGTRVIESSVDGYRNDIEGAKGHGIEISGTSDNLVIQGNNIEASGKDGILIDVGAATSVLVGGADELLRNDVRNSGEWGIHLTGGSNANGPSGVVVAGNYTYMNERGGMQFAQVGDVLIGGAASEPGLAPGNEVRDGMSLLFANGAKVQGNLIFNQSGPEDAPGLYVGGPNNLIGGESPEEGNRIVGFGTGELAANRPTALFDEGSDTIIQGNVITGAITGLLLQGHGHSVIDNVISGNAGHGLRVISLGGEEVQIRGNRIGVMKNGMSVDPNGAAGIVVEAPNVHIGGVKSGAACEGPCNVISGNGEDAGIRIEKNATGVTVRGNMIGVGVDGSRPVPNFWGIIVSEADATIGGSSGAEDGICDGACNVISGNTGHGIRSTSDSGGVDRLTISGNYIGKTLTEYAGNLGDGISIGSGTVVVIGDVVGFADGTTGNVIAANSGVGVSACGDRWSPEGPQQVTVRANQIYDNGRVPAFELSRACSIRGAYDGITMNDPDDSDVGPNGLLNSPTLVASRPREGDLSLLVLWTGDREESAANYQVDIYASKQCRGYTADARLRVANRSFTFPLSSSSDFDTLAVTVPFDPEMPYYTATFTDADNNTSEFGNCLRSDPEQQMVILRLAAGDAAQASGLLATLRSSTGKQAAADEMDVIVTSLPTSDPGDLFEETVATSPNGTYVQPMSTTGRVWQVTPSDVTPAGHDVCLDVSTMTADDVDLSVVVTRNPLTGGVWTPLDTYKRTVNDVDYACADEIPVFGHYALASGAAPDAMPPQLVSPGSGTTILSTTPLLEWASADGATGYDVQVAFDPSFATILRDTMGITSTTWVVRDQLPAGQVMHWRVRTRIDAGMSPWSQAYTFITDPTAVNIEDTGRIPDAFSLTSIYPNPNNGEAQVLFELPEPATVSIQVYDLLGRHVGEVLESQVAAGTHHARFNATGLPSGLYLVRMRTGAFMQTRSFMVVR